MGQSVSLANPGQPQELTIPGRGTVSSPHYPATANGLPRNHIGQRVHHHHPTNNISSSSFLPAGGPKPTKRQQKKKKVVGVKKTQKSGQTVTRKASSAGAGNRPSHRNGAGVTNSHSFRSPSNHKPDVNHRRTTHAESNHTSEVHKGDSSDGPLPSTVLRRHRRLSANTNSSVGTNGHLPPGVTVTEHSEAESTDIDFDPVNFNNRPGDENRTSTPKARPQDMDISVSKYQSVSETVQRRQSPLGSSGKERRTSGTSNLSTESESNRNSRKINKRHSTEIRLKKGLLSKNDPKADAANKWSNIVSEFEEVYVDHSKLGGKQEKKKEPRKVNKLTNLDQYENVRQVFTRSMPLPMQMAPPGARVEDIEAETSSETSSYSWNLMTPMGKTSRHSSSSQEQVGSSRAHMGIQSHSDNHRAVGASSQMEMSKSAGASGMTSRSHHSSTNALNSRDVRSSREVNRSGMAAGSRSRSASRSGSRSQSATGYRSHSQERQVARSGKQKQSKSQSGGKQGNVVEESVMKETRQVVQSRGGGRAGGGGGGRGGAKTVKYQSKGHKGVKFRKVTDINEQAAIVVDDVIQSALRLLYGDRHRSSSASSKLSSGHASHQSSNHSSKKSSHVQQHVEHVVEKHIDHRKGHRNDMRIDRRDIRTGSIRPIPYSGQYSKEKTTAYSTRSLPPPITKRSSNTSGDMAGMYDMVIQPLGEEKTQKSEAEIEWYRRLKEGGHRPRGEDDSNSTTSIKIYHNDWPSQVSSSSYQEHLNVTEAHNKHKVNPPTITKGTVTRVFHDLEQEGQVPSSTFLAQLQSMQHQQPPSGEYSIDYSTNTWPLSRSYPNLPIDATGLTSAPLSPSSSQFNTLPAGLNTSTEMFSDHSAYYSDGAYPSGQHSILIGNMPGGYIDDRIYLSPPRGSPPGGSYTLASITSAGRPVQDQGRVDLMIDTNQLMRSLPLRLPSYPQHNTFDAYRVDDISHSINLPAIEEKEEHSGTYSNEPIIVADLLDKNEQPKSGSFYSTEDNARVNMNKNQQLNFYVFNQQSPQPGVPNITYAAQDIQARVGTETQQMTNFFLEEGEMKEMISQAIQAYQPEDPYVPDHKEYTVYHKQTQTRPTPEPKPKKPSSPKRFERKKEIIKKYIPRRQPSPERPKSPVVHRETHHYITKEREIEKLPPAPPPKAEFSVQTDMAGNEWEDEMDSLYRALNDAEQRAYEAERAMDEMQSSNAAMESVVREMHQVVEEQEKKKPPREIPVAIVKKEPEPKPESDSESEEEFYEWTEIEEKEQRLSMAIFEEIEFNLQRSQGGNTSNESGKKSEIVPWIMPEKYEAVVDRRRQKVTQIKDIEREGDKFHYQAGNVPEGLGKSKSNLALEFDLLEDDLEGGGGVTEQRDMTLRREQNISHPTSTNEYHIEINSNGDYPDAESSERHYSSMEFKPRTPAGKRNYMSTFDHEMGRAKNIPMRARGRTNYRSDKHIPLAIKNAESFGTDIGGDTRHKTSMTRDIQISRNPGTESTYMTTIHKEGEKHNKKNGGNGKHSVNLIRDVLGLSKGQGGQGNSEHSEQHVTSMTRTPAPSSMGGSHSTTYITEKSSKPGNNSPNTKHHVTKYTRHIKGGGHGNNDSHNNISSSEIHIDKLRGFEIPVGKPTEGTHYYSETDIQLGKPDYQELSGENSEKSSRFVSRFDPGNIFFTARSRSGSSETLLEMAKEPVAGHPGRLADDHLHDNDSLPDALPVVEAEHMKRKSVVTKSENQQHPPKIHSHLEEDGEGNLVRVTTTEQQMTKTVDYVSEPEENRKVSRPKKSDEALVEESFVEVNLTTENIEDNAGPNEDESNENEMENKTMAIAAAYGPEVVSETSVAYKAIEYDDQEKSLGIGGDEQGFQEDKFLYDMKTATLKPVKIKDKKSGETLMQYSLGDTMVTEL